MDKVWVKVGFGLTCFDQLMGVQTEQSLIQIKLLTQSFWSLINR
jgi:hypothetical protein